MTVPTPEALTMGEIGRTLARLEKGQDALLSRLESFGQHYVTRGEWSMSRDALNKDLDELRDELHARRVPWTNIVSAVVAAAALALTVVQLVT
jgi:hypothetical protein